MSDAVLRVEDLRVTGPAGVIVERMSVMLHAGTTLAIVGESGSGKSMTAKAITGLLPPGVTATGTMWLGSRASTWRVTPPRWVRYAAGGSACCCRTRSPA